MSFKLPHNAPNGVSWNVKSLGNLLIPNSLQVQLNNFLSQLLWKLLKGSIYFYDSITPWSRSCLDGLGFIYGSPTVVGVVKHKKKEMAADQTP